MGDHGMKCHDYGTGIDYHSASVYRFICGSAAGRKVPGIVRAPHRPTSAIAPNCRQPCGACKAHRALTLTRVIISQTSGKVDEKEKINLGELEHT